MNRDTLKQIMIDQKDIYLNNPYKNTYCPPVARRAFHDSVV